LNSLASGELTLNLLNLLNQLILNPYQPNTCFSQASEAFHNLIVYERVGEAPLAMGRKVIQTPLSTYFVWEIANEIY
jgi:hypothetical protein